MTTMALPDPPVDTRHERSVWFARPALPSAVTPTGRRAPVPVGPGVRAFASPTTSGAHRDDVSGYPVQYAKVQPPPLREETLARHRLLDWLAQKIHQRIVLVLADAGYGKTTLLADFANRTRLRTLWYRLDEDDRDWISLLAHLVAAGREADPTFASRTAALLADTSLSGAGQDFNGITIPTGFSIVSGTTGQAPEYRPARGFFRVCGVHCRRAGRPAR